MRQTTINEFVKDINAVNKIVCGLIYAKGLFFNFVKNSFFKKALVTVEDCDRGCQPSTYNEPMITYFWEEVERTDKVCLKKYME